MKKITVSLVLLALALALVLAFGLAFVGCDDGSSPGGRNPESVTYTGASGGTTYTLLITENTARYAAQNGDAYELTVGAKISSGTVTNVSGGMYTLRPSNAATSFTATVSGSDITAVNGTITWTDGTTAPAPGAIGGGADSVSGTYVANGVPWNSHVVTITFTFSGTTFTRTTIRVAGAGNLVESGSFTVSNNIITCSVTYASDGKAGYSINLTIIDSDTLSSSFGDVYRRQ